MKTKIDHFYWVASASNNPGEPAFHLQVIDVAETMDEVDEIGGKERARMLNVAEAIGEGFDLSVIAKTINAAALTRCEALAATIAEKEQQATALKDAKSALETRVAELEAKG